MPPDGLFMVGMRCRGDYACAMDEDVRVALVLDTADTGGDVLAPLAEPETWSGIRYPPLTWQRPSQVVRMEDLLAGRTGRVGRLGLRHGQADWSWQYVRLSNSESPAREMDLWGAENTLYEPGSAYYGWHSLMVSDRNGLALDEFLVGETTTCLMGLTLEAEEAACAVNYYPGYLLTVPQPPARSYQHTIYRYGTDGSLREKKEFDLDSCCIEGQTWFPL